MTCKIPWAPFALACFLQDAMELSSVKTNDVEMETDASASTSWPQNGKRENIQLTVFNIINFLFFIFPFNKTNLQFSIIANKLNYFSQRCLLLRSTVFVKVSLSMMPS